MRGSRASRGGRDVRDGLRDTLGEWQHCQTGMRPYLLLAAPLARRCLTGPFAARGAGDACCGSCPGALARLLRPPAVHHVPPFRSEVPGFGGSVEHLPHCFAGWQSWAKAHRCRHQSVGLDLLRRDVFFFGVRPERRAWREAGLGGT